LRKAVCIDATGMAASLKATGLFNRNHVAAHGSGLIDQDQNACSRQPID
jgi:hypothetical protein